MSCTYYNGISPLFLILLTSLLYCLPPQLEYGLPEDTDLGLPYSHQFPNTKYSSCYMVEAQSIFVELMDEP